MIDGDKQGFPPPVDPTKHQSPISGRGLVFWERAARWLGWLVLLAIGIFSLSPPKLRPVTSAPGFAEHFFAFFIPTLLLGLGRRNWHYLIRIGALLVIYSATLEVAQLWVPGRHSRLNDLFLSVAGIGCGAIAAYFIWPRRKGD